MEVKLIKIALMNELDVRDEQSDFELKYTANLNIEKILSKPELGITLDNYDNTMPQMLELIFEELSNSVIKDNADIDTLGMWLTYEDKIVDNSIKLSILNDIQKYGDDDINSIYEFYKMTETKVSETPQ